MMMVLEHSTYTSSGIKSMSTNVSLRDPVFSPLLYRSQWQRQAPVWIAADHRVPPSPL